MIMIPKYRLSTVNSRANREDIFISRFLIKVFTIKMNINLQINFQTGKSECSNRNGMCSTFCLPKSASQISCKCEDDVYLMEDGRTCEGGNETLLSVGRPLRKLSFTCVKIILRFRFITVFVQKKSLKLSIAQLFLNALGKFTVPS